MSKYKLIQIVCWLIVFFVFMGLAVWFLFGSNFQLLNTFSIQNLSGPYEEEGRYEVDTEYVKSLDVNWTAGGVIVRPYDGDEIQIIEFVQRNLDEDEKLTYYVDDNTLTISYCEKKMRILDPMPPKKLELYVPEELAAGLSNVIIDCVSASIDAYDLSADYFHAKTVSGEGFLTSIKAGSAEVKSTSGTFEIEDINATVITLKTVSGGIRVQGLEAEDITAHSTSGTIKLSGASSDRLELETVSGDVDYDGSFLDMTAKSTSGTLNITEEAVPTSFSIKTVSGEANLTMPEVEEFNLYYKTVSGNFNSDIPVRSQEEGEADFKIKTTSGDITINELQ